MAKNNFEELHKLAKAMEGDDSLPLKKGATRLVFGTGNTEAEIVCIGEGPGYWEDQKGEPFVGNAGKLLDQLLVLAGLTRKKVFITNVVHHRPPENRDPLPEEIEAYGTYLDKIMDIIGPKVILTLGRYSMAKFLPGVLISSVHGKKYEVVWHGKNLIVIPMYHPAASLRNGNVLTQEKADFVNLKTLLEKIHQEKKEEESKITIEQESLL
jgi:uracil-DNA glycosylase